MKHIPNIITAFRLLGAVCLLLSDPAGAVFWVIYGLCGVSDMLDGSIVPIAIVAGIATFAAVQEGHFIRKRKF